jgi:hypothetical protein
VFRWAFIGSLETADFGGLDIWKSVVKNLAPVLSNEIKIPAFVEENLDVHHCSIVDSAIYVTIMISKLKCYEVEDNEYDFRYC